MVLSTNIRSRRSELKLSQKELAAKAGVSQQLINALESGSVRSTKFLHEIAMALGTTISELEPKFSASAGPVESPASEFDEAEELPVFGATDTGGGTMIVTLEPVDFIDRPAPLENVRGAYGLIAVSEHMMPEFELGDILLVNPHLPPIPDSTCVFHRTDRERTITRIRRLLRATTGDWLVKSWNLPTEGEPDTVMPRETWNRCHRIVGRFNRR